MVLCKVVDLIMVQNFYSKTLVLICFISYGETVPIDYCLQPLDKGDCGAKPTHVFSYYKPGSRCEIEIWRGCPTFNKFDNEFLCSHHCIGKLWSRTDEKQTDYKMLAVELEQAFDITECSTPMNEADCGVKEKFRYTFTGLMCVRVEWKGCESQNLFIDEATCVNTCNPQTVTNDLKNQLQELPIGDVEVIDKILDNAMADNNSVNPQQLHLKATDNQDANEIETEKTENNNEKTVEVENENRNANENVEVKNENINANENVEVKNENINANENVEVKNENVNATSNNTETASKAAETNSEDVQTVSVETEETTVAAMANDETESDTNAPETSTETTSEEVTTTTTEGTGNADEVVLP